MIYQEHYSWILEWIRDYRLASVVYQPENATYMQLVCRIAQN